MTKRRKHHQARLTRRAALTLVETVVSMSIMSLLMVGMGSAMMIASRALPSDDNPTFNAVETAGVADRLAEDLRTAIWIRERGVNAVEFTVPDRDADGLPERIRYSWSGTPGESLLREYNGSTPAAVLRDVQAFTLGYQAKSVVEEYPGPNIESAEVELSSFDGTTNLATLTVTNKTSVGQYFKPSLPVGAVNWSVTRVLYRAQSNGAKNGKTSIEFHTADAGNLPTATVLEQVIMLESGLPATFAWQPARFDTVTGLDPGQGLCLAFVKQSSNNTADIEYVATGVGRLDTGLLLTDKGGWIYDPQGSLRFYVYGTYTTASPPQTATRDYITSVSIRIRAGGDNAMTIETGTQTLNMPEVLDGMWETNFESDPTLDHNADGNPDWVSARAGGFSGGSLFGGVWTFDDQLDSFPNDAFQGLTTILLRFQAATIAASVSLTINPTDATALSAPLGVELELQPDATQTLRLLTSADGVAMTPVTQVVGLPAQIVELRLLIDPSVATISLRVNGIQRGTFTYNKFAVVNTTPYVSLLGSPGAGEFEHVSIRVSPIQ